MAMREEPVRSFMSRIAFLTRARVAIVDKIDDNFFYFCIYARCGAREKSKLSFSRIVKSDTLAPGIFWVREKVPYLKIKNFFSATSSVFP